MATVKIVLRNKPNKEGLMPLVMRITKNRKSSEIHIGYNIKPSEWDEVNQRVKKSHPNSTRLNHFILKKLSEATDSALELEASKTTVSSHAVKEKLKPSIGITFFERAEKYLEDLKLAGNYNCFTADKPRIKHFREFLGHDIAFQDINVSMLERFKAYLKGSGDHGERSAVNHLVVIRSVFSKAVKDNIVDQKHYPFGKGKMKIKFPDTVKVGLTKEEVARLESLPLEGNQHHARNLWLISYYFAGVRISDVLRLKWSDIQDGRLHYVMGKNEKGDSLKLPEKAFNIFEQYRDEQQHKDDFIFDTLKKVPNLDDNFIVKRTIAFKTSAVDKVLNKQVAPAAEIDKKLTCHIARHSFAQNATDVDVRILQRLFRHSKLETTIGYMGNFNHQAKDDALDKVLGL